MSKSSATVLLSEPLEVISLLTFLFCCLSGNDISGCHTEKLFLIQSEPIGLMLYVRNTVSGASPPGSGDGYFGSRWRISMVRVKDNPRPLLPMDTNKVVCHTEVQIPIPLGPLHPWELNSSSYSPSQSTQGLLRGH